MVERHVFSVAALHGEVLGGFLVDLGPPAIRAWHRGALRSRSVVALVDEEDGVIHGFVIGSLDPRRLRSDVLRQNAFGTVTGLALGLLRRPSCLPALLRSAWHPAGLPSDEVPELTYLAVRAGGQRKGLGTLLVEAFGGVVAARGATAYELSVEGDNAVAIAFYERRGFELVGEYVELGRSFRRYRREVDCAVSTS
jgi:ribosomal protein S18 acetylase RimI-like enzyme